MRIDDDLLRDLKKRAQKEKSSLTKILNHFLRRGIAGAQSSPGRKRPYREKTYAMGPPLVDLTKALAIAAELEDEETIARMARHK